MAATLMLRDYDLIQQTGHRVPVTTIGADPPIRPPTRKIRQRVTRHFPPPLKNVNAGLNEDKRAINRHHFAAPLYEREQNSFPTVTQEHSPRNTNKTYGKAFNERPRRRSTAPLAIPYTTPASEFLYGHSVVTSALKSNRKFYKLYLYDGDATESRGQDMQVRKLALAANCEVTRVGNDWLRLMDKMSGGRPHNGYVLEASPLPKLPVAGLRSLPHPRSSFEVILDHQSREDEAVNGTNTTVPYGSGYRRFPFLILLDGVVRYSFLVSSDPAIRVLTGSQRDPGNFGAIIRSAHFLGADGILICTRSSAPLTPVALKAAVGAAESLPLFSVDQPSDFIDVCHKNGWKFYAAVSPSSSDSGKVVGRPYYSTATLGTPTKDRPCVLILGSEGEGLRWNIQKKADYLVGIEAARTGYGDLDSLNVSVAAGLLCDAFLKRPAATREAKAMFQGTPITGHAEVSSDPGPTNPRIVIGSSSVEASHHRLF
ncbi:MAG: hypothetical protein Q9218_001262 [Villophora microphyllina]